MRESAWPIAGAMSEGVDALLAQPRPEGPSQIVGPLTRGPHLLAQDLLALRLALVGDHRAHFLLHAEELELPAHDAENGADAELRIERLEDLLLVGDARLFGGQVRGDEIGQRAAFADVVEDSRRLARQVRHERQQVAHPFAQTRACVRVAFARELGPLTRRTTSPQCRAPLRAATWSWDARVSVGLAQ
jgi:hypothetical protein